MDGDGVVPILEITGTLIMVAGESILLTGHIILTGAEASGEVAGGAAAGEVDIIHLTGFLEQLPMGQDRTEVVKEVIPPVHLMGIPEEVQ